MEPSRSLSAWKKGVYASVPVLALLACLEIGFRIGLGGRIQDVTGVVEWQNARWLDLTYFWDQYHPHFGWTNLAGYRSDERAPFRATINAQGLRGNTDYAPRAAPGVKRVAVFGDSTTFGEEVDDDQTVPFYLEVSLPDSEVLNFGVRGYGLGQMALRLEEEGFGFAPDHVVVVLLLPEDVNRTGVSFFTHAKPVFFMAERGLEIGNHPVPADARQSWLLRHSFAAAWLWGRPKEWPDTISQRERLVVARALLERIRAGCETRGIGFSLVTIATARALDLMVADPSRRREINAMRGSLAEINVDSLDLIAPLAFAYRERGRALVASHGHWSAEGNRIIAGWIAEHLAAGQAAGLRPTR